MARSCFLLDDSVPLMIQRYMVSTACLINDLLRVNYSTVLPSTPFVTAVKRLTRIAMITGPLRKILETAGVSGVEKE